MSNTVSIKPKEFGRSATQLEIKVQGFDLNATSGTAVAVFKDAEGNDISRERVEIPEEVFTKWGTDDSIIEKYVLKELELKKA